MHKVCLKKKKTCFFRKLDSKFEDVKNVIRSVSRPPEFFLIDASFLQITHYDISVDHGLKSLDDLCFLSGRAKRETPEELGYLDLKFPSKSLVKIKSSHFSRWIVQRHSNRR